jgi:DNA polymerase-3 subunit alpha
MPDVDMDFADDRRDEVLDYVRKKYGNDHVAQIITFGTMAARAAIRDTGRALGLPYDFCDKTAKLIPMFSNIKDAMEEVKELKDLYNSGPDAKKLLDSAQKLEGVARHASMHACGVVITKEPVTEYTPLQKIIGKEEGTVTQYSSSTKYSVVEKIGLLKMDFLGLKNLTIIQNTLRIVKKIRGQEIKIDDIPLEDKETFSLLQDGKTTGVFQLESSGMKRYLKQLRPTIFEDIIAMVALYRPGPMDWIPDFIAGKHGRKKIMYAHPKLEPILQNTYGVAVYQEQIMQIARDLAGFTLGEADVLRKAMGKKIPELIKEQRIKFVDGCVKNEIKKNVAEKIFSFIEPFAGYGFNRSHAACYALVGYQTAYLKAHFPAEFMAALLTSDQNDIDRVAIEISECQEMGIEILPPNINESFEDFAVIKSEDGIEKIRFGLNAIKNVGKNVAAKIVEERKKAGKFSTLTDFLQRVTDKDVNKKSLEALTKVGAMEELGERNLFLSNIESVLLFSKNIQRSKNSSQNSLFGEAILSAPTLPLLPAPEAKKNQKLSWEKELLGLYVSDHPVSEYQDYLNKIAISMDQITKEHVGRKVTLGGVITKIQKIFLKSQKTMVFATLEDMKGRVELLIFPKILESLGDLFQEEKIIVASGTISDKDGVFKLLVDTAKAITPQEMENFKRIELTHQKNGAPKRDFDFSKIPENNLEKKKLLIALPENTNQEIIKKLSEFFDKCEAGAMKVYISIGNSRLETPYCISDNQLEEMKTNLQTFAPESRISTF